MMLETFVDSLLARQRESAARDRRFKCLLGHYERCIGPLPSGWRVVDFNYPVWNKFTLRPLPRMYRMK